MGGGAGALGKAVMTGLGKFDDWVSPKLNIQQRAANEIAQQMERSGVAPQNVASTLQGEMARLPRLALAGQAHLASLYGHNGQAVFSDDLSMAGARRIAGVEVSYTDAAEVALNAGCDLVLLCNQSADGGAAVDALLEGLLASQALGRWHADEDSEQRRVALLPQTQPLTWDQLMHDPAYQRALERLP